jgi:hypothetical protein
MLISDSEINKSKEAQVGDLGHDSWIFKPSTWQFLSKNQPSGLAQDTRTHGIYVEPQNHYVIVYAWPENRWDEMTQVFRPPSPFKETWSVLIEIGLNKFRYDWWEQVDEHLIIKVKVSPDSYSCDVVRLDWPLKRYAQLGDQYLTFLHSGPSPSLTPKCSVELAKDIYLRVSMENREVMGVPMFVLNIMEPSSSAIAQDGLRHYAKSLVATLALR